MRCAKPAKRLFDPARQRQKAHSTNNWNELRVLFWNFLCCSSPSLPLLNRMRREKKAQRGGKKTFLFDERDHEKILISAWA